jgi:hypothetical protein
VRLIWIRSDSATLRHGREQRDNPRDTAMCSCVWGTAGLGAGVTDTIHPAVVTTLPQKRLHLLLMVAIRSCGAAVAARIASWAIAHHISFTTHYRIVGIVCRVSAVCTPEIAITQGAQAVTNDTAPDLGVHSRLLLGLLAAASIVPSQAVYQWGVQLITSLDAPASLRGSGLLGFTIAQALCLGALWALNTPSSRFARSAELTAALGSACLVAASLSLLPSLWVMYATVVGITLVGLRMAPIPLLAFQAASAITARRLRTTQRCGTVAALQCLQPLLPRWVLALLRNRQAFSLD